MFESLKMDFSKGINIFIGENGTGKTHMMKMMYAPLSIKNNKSRMVFWEDIFTHNTEVQTVPDYFRRNKDKEFLINIEFDNDQPYLNKDGIFSSKVYDVNTVFIPATEMLSHSKGFLALERERHIPFDRTLIDIIAKSELGESKKVSNLNNEVLNKISNIIDGKVIYENDTFFILKENGLKVEFSMESEGVRKIGLLWRLIRNGLIDENSILFWDEPEANINPMYIPVIVEMLFELQRNGVQIFISTHDYILSKYFEVKRKEDNELMFFSFYKSDNGVQCEKNSYFKNLKENPIVAAFDKLLDEVYDKNLGD